MKNEKENNDKKNNDKNNDIKNDEKKSNNSIFFVKVNLTKKKNIDDI